MKGAPLGKVVRKYEIKRRRTRQNKLRTLRDKLAKTSDVKLKNTILAKIKRISPFYKISA